MRANLKSCEHFPLKQIWKICAKKNFTFISASFKTQKKYRSVRIKIEFSTFHLAKWTRSPDTVWQTDLAGIPVRWFPDSWSLAERKERDKFQLAVKNVPDDFTLNDIWKEGHLTQFFTDLKIKSFKFVKMPDGSTKWLTCYEIYVDKRNALETGITLGAKLFNSENHSLPALGFKSTRRSKKQDAKTSPINSTPARGGKKTVTKTPRSIPKDASSQPKEKKGPAKNLQQELSSMINETKRKKLLAEISALLTQLI